MIKNLRIGSIIGVLCFLAVGCSKGRNIYTVEQADALQSAVTPLAGQIQEDTIKIEDKESGTDLSYEDFWASYEGYLDDTKLLKEYAKKDYDGDGLSDRIYREITKKNDLDQAMEIGYRIDFGNGDVLEIGNFDDNTLAPEVLAGDLTGDGKNELIFCGRHSISTFPSSSSEIAVYQKKDNVYKRIPLPVPNYYKVSKENPGFRTGYSIYVKSIHGNQITLCSTVLNYKETIDIEDDITLDWFKQIAKEEAGGDSWHTAIKEYDGLPALVLYINIGYKYYCRDLSVYLIWQEGEFKPVQTKFE